MLKMPTPLWSPDDPAGGVPPTPPAGDPGASSNPPSPAASGAPGSLIGGEPPKAGEPPTDAKPSDPPAPDPMAALESLDGLVPEGFEIPEDRRASFLEAVNGAKSRTELVGTLVKMHTEEIAAIQNQAAEQWNQTQRDWQAEIKADPTYGGAKLEASLAIAKETALKLGGEPLLQAMHLTGMGNNVHFFRALMKAAELIPKEGSPSPGDKAVPPKDLASRLYPTTH